MSDPTTDLAPEALFVVACPTCQGQVAASGSLCGRDACCPLCASLFHVPSPAVAAAHVAGADSGPSGIAPRAANSAAAGIGEDWQPVIDKLAAPRRDRMSDRGTQPPGVVAFEVPANEPAASGPDLAEPPAGEGSPAAASFDPLPDVPASAPPQAGELEFKEPVRMVRIGGEEIEIRRLTPEERRSRRARRNLMMIVIGISILLAIVAVFGTPRRP